MASLAPKFITVGAARIRRYPGMIWKPMWPFLAASGLVFWGVNTIQNKMMRSDEFKNDPRNPLAKSGGH